jgi:hypothetical protein
MAEIQWANLEKWAYEYFIDFYFKEPPETLKKDETPFLISPLCQLRHDIDYCLGLAENKRDLLLRALKEDTDKINELFEETPALYTATMGIFAGIDILAKLCAGNNREGESGKRFKGFTNHYFQLNEEQNVLLWEMRNALLHSFSLYFPHKGIEYNFEPIISGGDIITGVANIQDTRYIYWLDVATLYGKFEDAINKYRDDISINRSLLHKFLKMIYYSFQINPRISSIPPVPNFNPMKRFNDTN